MVKRQLLTRRHQTSRMTGPGTPREKQHKMLKVTTALRIRIIMRRPILILPCHLPSRPDRH